MPACLSAVNSECEVTRRSLDQVSDSRVIKRVCEQTVEHSSSVKVTQESRVLLRITADERGLTGPQCPVNGLCPTEKAAEGGFCYTRNISNKL